MSGNGRINICNEGAQDVIDGAACVTNSEITIEGSVTSVSGTLKAYVIAPTDASPTTAATGIWTSATGCKAYWVEPIFALTTSVLIAASSTTDADSTAVIALLTTADGEIDTPTGAANPAAVITSVATREPIKTVYDGTTKIKTICVRASQAAFTGKVILYTVE